jgi:hypothetical protein
MPRVNTVEHARKDYPEAGIKKGDKYYWWKFRYGGKHMSTTPPKASQLTQSSFLSQLYEIQERLQCLEATDAESLKSEVEEIAGELRSLSEECENNRSNMPDGLQEGEVGQMLESRTEACSSAADELEGIDFDIDEEALIEEAKEELAQEYEDEGKWLSEDEKEITEELKAEGAQEDLAYAVPDHLKCNKEENEKLRKEIEEKIPELVEDKKQERLDEIIGEIQNISIDCE